MFCKVCDDLWVGICDKVGHDFFNEMTGSETNLLLLNFEFHSMTGGLKHKLRIVTLDES